jgi:hypothetical protein
VTALPMIIRWISDVPSKIVKLLGAVGYEQGAYCDHVSGLAASQ